MIWKDRNLLIATKLKANKSERENIFSSSHWSIVGHHILHTQMYLVTVRRRFNEVSSPGSSRCSETSLWLCNLYLHSISDRVVDDHQDKLVKLLHLFVEHVHNKFNKYAFYFFLCELLNIVITVIMVKFWFNNGFMLEIIFCRSFSLMYFFTINILTMDSTSSNTTGLG